MARIGTVKLSKDLILQFVLFVSKLDCNLLSISKVTRDYKCVIKFFNNLCEFQAMKTGRTIDSARECSGLYLITRNNSPSGQALQVGSPSFQSSLFNVSIPSLNNEVVLWHFRLGHPNFMYLEKLFPLLFKNKSPSSFQCEIC